MRFTFSELTDGPELAPNSENLPLVIAVVKQRLRHYSEIRVDGGVLTDEQAADEKIVEEALTELVRNDLLRAIAAEKLQLCILTSPDLVSARAGAEMRLMIAEEALAKLDAKVSG